MSTSEQPDQDAALAGMIFFAATAREPHQPPYTDLISDRIERREQLTGYFAYELAAARRRGWQLDICGNQAGLALWARYPAHTTPPPFAPDPYAAEALRPALAARVAEFEAERHRARLAAVHERKHLHLRLLTARFGSRHLEVEAALLAAAHLTRLDQYRVSAYADPSRPEIRDLLRSHGFTPAAIPAHGLPFYPMVREPGAT